MEKKPKEDVLKKYKAERFKFWYQLVGIFWGSGSCFLAVYGYEQGKKYSVILGLFGIVIVMFAYNGFMWLMRKWFDILYPGCRYIIATEDYSKIMTILDVVLIIYYLWPAN